MRLKLRKSFPSAGDTGLVARVLLIGLTGGLSLSAALILTADEVEGPIGLEVRALLREGRRVGLQAALGATQGALRPLALLLSRAHASGAPMVSVVTAFVEEQSAVERSEVVLRLRRLPVKLLIPLTLLILPGFVVLVVGPAFLSALNRLLGPIFGL